MAVLPTVATNRPQDGETVAAAIKHVLADVLDHPKKTKHEVCIATAYFNPGGFLAIAEQLERAQKVRLLLGAEPAPATGRVRKLRSASIWDPTGGALTKALEDHAQTLEEDRDLLGFTIEADEAAKRLIDWLHEDRVEVRRLMTDFLHGKAFLVSTDYEAVLAGSSNFTAAGLYRNRELNLGVYQPESVEKVVEWFDEQWQAAEHFDLAAVYDTRFLEHTPWLIYLRMLWEQYGEELMEEAADDRDVDRIHLTSFQRDGVWRAKRIIDDHHGVLIADGVGLGKTFLGGALLEEYVRQRRQRALIIAPAALRDGPWEWFTHQFNLPVTLLSFEEFLSEMRGNVTQNGKGRLLGEKDEYSLVLIDEAHALRNPDAERSKALKEFLQSVPPKDVVLLTATPVNNHLLDLHVLLTYFLRDDAAFAARGIPSLLRRFQQAAAVDPEDLTPELLFDVIDAIAVRRTRHFVKRYYANETIVIDGEKQTISFPDPHVVSVDYEVTPGDAELFGELAVALGAHADADPLFDPNAEAPEGVLTLARYAPSRYALDESVDGYELQLAGLLRSGLLKRYESSAKAFALTCGRMAKSHSDFLTLLDEGRVATGAALKAWAASDSDSPMPDIVLDESDAAARYDVDRLRADVIRDRDLLLHFAETAHALTQAADPKLDALVEQLAAIAKQAEDEAISNADERNLRKVIVFSYFADTVDWIHERLCERIASDDRLAAFRGRTTTVSGSDGEDKTRVLYGFAPVSTQAPVGQDEDRIDLLMTTDVLAEGVNLQQARHIINYDLPWNPMRLVQRHGRIDRIGSKHSKVFLRCFFPDRQLDEMLKLEERLKRKLAQAAASIGVESEALPGSQVSDHTFAETREQIERLRQQNPELFEAGGEVGGAFSGEEYRQELRHGMEDERIAELVRSLPWGSGSGLKRAGNPGFVFCARVGDHPQPVFRWVPLGAEGAAGAEPSGDLLGCLARAHAEPTTPRHLDEQAHTLAYDAWDVARTHIHKEWQFATDPANLQPRVPKPMRDAAELITRIAPAGMTRAAADELVARLNGNYNQRIQAAFRGAMRSEATEQERADRVAELADEFGLQSAPPPQPLPAITVDDVHLVCWLAVSSADENAGPFFGSLFGTEQGTLV